MTQRAGEALTLDIKSVVIHAKQWGDRTGIPVLALHGWLDNAASFDALAPLLQHVNLVAVDMPGHGHSGHYPPGFHYHLLDMVQTVLSIAQQLQWSQFILMGHSLGGIIAALAAASAPEQIQKLILIDAIGPLTEDVAQAPARLARAVKASLAPEKTTRNIYPDVQAAAKVRQQSGDLSDEAALVLTQRGLAKIAEGYVWRFDAKLLAPSMLYFTESQAQAFLSAIKVPTLLIEAESGYLQKANKKLVKQRLQCIQQLTHFKVAGGHHVHMEDAAAVADIINEFLQA